MKKKKRKYESLTLREKELLKISLVLLCEMLLPVLFQKKKKVKVQM